MTREDIINTVKQEDPDLLWCPAQVLRHMTLAFRPSNGLSSVLFAEGDPETLFVYDPTKFATERHARRRFMEDRESFSCERHLAWLHARRPVRPAVV